MFFSILKEILKVSCLHLPLNLKFAQMMGTKFRRYFMLVEHFEWMDGWIQAATSISHKKSS